MRWIAALVLIPLLVACGSNGGPATGTERGDCYPNSTCNAGLSCVYGVCLYVPDGFQAGEVAPDVAMATIRDVKARVELLESAHADVAESDLRDWLLARSTATHP